MANNHGYIGRAPGDSTVIIARQQYTPGGIQTDFTFDSGYTVGYVDAYINGVRQIEGTDYTASDGSFTNDDFFKNPRTYITTVGLYNDANELLAVAKLSQPLSKDFTKEALIRIKLDY